MKPPTLRRKLQKKKKHKPYRKCPKCGKRMDVHLVGTIGEGRFRLFKCCGWKQVYLTSPSDGVTSQPGHYGCGYWQELFKSGGGIGRRISSRGNSVGRRAAE